MKKRFIRCALSALTLLLTTTFVHADVTVPGTDVKDAAKATVDKSKTGVKAAADKTKAAADKTKAGAKTATDKTKAAAGAAADKTKAATGAAKNKATAAASASKDKAKATVDAAKDKTKATVDASKDKAKAATAGATAAVQPKTIDINSASAAELKAIPGVGDSYAAKIIAGRPYANKTQLKTRDILPAPLYEKVKDQVVAKQGAKK